MSKKSNRLPARSIRLAAVTASPAPHGFDVAYEFQLSKDSWIRAAKTPAVPPFELMATAVELEARGTGETEAKTRKFSMKAYTGGAMQVSAYGLPVVVDFAGLDVGNSARPILIDHDSDLDSVLGQTTSIEVKGGALIVSGNIFAQSDKAKRVVEMNDAGFKFQASIGARVVNREFVPEGSKATVNGREFNGPILIARKSVLGEVSFVALGADDRTSANIAASAAEKGSIMNFEQWLEAKGIAADGLADAVRNILKAQFDAEQGQTEKENTQNKVKATGAGEGGGGAADPLADIRASAAAESKRINGIAKICASYRGRVDADKLAEIEPKAIEAGWDGDKLELELLRAARPQSAPAGHVKGKAPTTEVLEAAMCRTRGIDVEKSYKPEVLEASDKFRNLGIQEILLITASANGYSSGPMMRINQGNIAEVLEYAFPVRGSAVSTISLPNIFSNVANKEILAGYNEEDQTWREIATVKSVRDFKQVTSYRLLDNMEYEELAPAGEIKHGTVGEETYTRQAKTYAKMFGLDRVDIINDDMGALDDLRTRIGRGSAKKLNNVFWKKFLDNSTLFTAGRGNYITGSTTTLLDDGVGLQQGVTAFRKLKSPTADGAKRVGGRASILLVPPELEFVADRLYQSTNVNTGGAATGASIGNSNIHAGKYKPVVSDWLSDSDFTGYSATAWYLFRQGISAMVVSFLNGVQTPTVESAQADFNRLGIQFRGYHDFGADHAEYVAGIKSKGAA